MILLLVSILLAGATDVGVVAVFRPGEWATVGIVTGSLAFWELLALAVVWIKEEW